MMMKKLTACILLLALACTGLLGAVRAECTSHEPDYSCYLELDRRCERIDGDDTCHTLVIVKRYDCLNCGDYWGWLEEYETAEHTFNADGKCTGCRYMKENAEEGCRHWETDRDVLQEVCEPFNDSEHLLRRQYRVCCEICGEVLDDNHWEEETVPHVYEDIFECADCGYLVPIIYEDCTHIQRVRWQADQSYAYADENSHTYFTYYQCICADCGEDVGMTVDSHAEAHQWQDNVCTLCYYRKGCDHESMTDQLAGADYNAMNAQWHMTTACIKYVCDDCGETVGSSSYQELEEHQFQGNMCTDCGYEKACGHQTLQYYETKVQYRQVNEETHMITCYYDPVCSDCGETLTSTYTQEVKLHAFVGSKCADCGYEKQAAATPAPTAAPAPTATPASQKLAEPLGVKTAVDQTTLTATFDRVENAGSYVFSLRDLDDNALLNSHQRVSDRTIVVSGLTPGHRYRLAICAVPKGETSSSANCGWAETYFTVPQAKPALGEGDYFNGSYVDTSPSGVTREAWECLGYARYYQSQTQDTVNKKLVRTEFGIAPSVKNNALASPDAQYRQQVISAITEAGAGAHVRVYNENGKDEKGSWGHSFVITGATEEGITIIQANGSYGEDENGNRIPYEKNLITTAHWTWDEFFDETTYGKRGLSYIETYE